MTLHVALSITSSSLPRNAISFRQICFTVYLLSSVKIFTFLKRFSVYLVWGQWACVFFFFLLIEQHICHSHDSSKYSISTKMKESETMFTIKLEFFPSALGKGSLICLIWLMNCLHLCKYSPHLRKRNVSWYQCWGARPAQRLWFVRILPRELLEEVHILLQQDSI